MKRGSDSTPARCGYCMTNHHERCPGATRNGSTASARLWVCPCGCTPDRCVECKRRGEITDQWTCVDPDDCLTFRQSRVTASPFKDFLTPPQIPSPQGPRAVPAPTGPTQGQKLREWARTHGYSVADRGKLSQEIRDAYAKATGEEIIYKARSRREDTTMTNAPTETTRIREWARANGHQVGAKGRIAADIVTAYHAASKSDGGTPAPKAAPAKKTTATKKAGAKSAAQVSAKKTTAKKASTPAAKKTPAAPAASAPVSLLANSTTVRDWARRNGYQVDGYDNVPAGVLKAYQRDTAV